VTTPEQRATWRREAEHRSGHLTHTRILALLDDVEAREHALRDMEIERNMLRSTLRELLEFASLSGRNFTPADIAALDGDA
jgi:hypothetical protein